MCHIKEIYEREDNGIPLFISGPHSILIFLLLYHTVIMQLFLFDLFHFTLYFHNVWRKL